MEPPDPLSAEHPLDDFLPPRTHRANGSAGPPSTVALPAPSLDRARPARPQRGDRQRAWWLALLLLWVLASAADHRWLAMDLRLPSWDQADYLNSAVDHGRALGLLPGGGWRGVAALLDLSPKIPPLASLVNGSVMAVAGDSADQASWALSLWHGLLLAVVACWARDLAGRRFALLAALLVALLPALAELRVDFTLDLALAATTTLALWLLGRWQRPSVEGGGHWGTALAAALAIGSAVLVKQSALLVLTLPSLWCLLRSLGRPKRMLQAGAALTLVIAMALPWLHHNWITTLGGTNRAVLESAAREGDPPVLSLASLLWYPRLWPKQLGVALLLPGLAGGGLALWRRRGQRAFGLVPAWERLSGDWRWLIGCSAACLLCTTLSPNKDGRYIAPLLPLLAMLLTRGWWQLGLELQPRLGAQGSAVLLAAGVLGGGGALLRERDLSLQRQAPSPAAAAMAELRRQVGTAPVTLLTVPDGPDLNEQTLTSLGRLGGGNVLARSLGGRSREYDLALRRSSWVLLATGDQGTAKPQARELSRRVRGDRHFLRLAHWPWTQGREVELWQRRRDAPAEPFDATFITMARGMERGPAGLRTLFAKVGPEHQLDGHFLYMKRVRAWAEERLRSNPNDPDALWSLALIETLRNRPPAAAGWYERLQKLKPGSPWPAAYRSLVLLADWRPGSAANVVHDSTEEAIQHPVMRALRSLSRGLVGHPLSLESLRVSIPEAIAAVKADLARPAETDHTQPRRTP